MPAADRLQAASPFELITRLGFASRAAMYAAIGYLTLRLGRTEDNAGALGFLQSAGGGLLLGIMALGFFGYGAWRLCEAALDGEGQGTDAAGVAKRLGGAVSGLIHLALCWVAVRLASGGAATQGDTAERGASTVMALPGGGAGLFVVAAVLLVVGGFQLVRAWKLGFLKHLDHRVAGRGWMAWIGRAGYVARGVVFVAMALFMWRAARRSEAAEAGGMDQALDSFPEELRLLVAAGLLLFGAFSLVEAIYRRIEDPDVLARLRRLS